MKRMVLLLPLLLVAVPGMAASDTAEPCSVTVEVRDSSGALPGAWVGLYDEPPRVEDQLQYEDDDLRQIVILSDGSGKSLHKRDHESLVELLTSVQGRVTLHDLDRDRRYWIAVTFPGYAGVVDEFMCASLQGPILVILRVAERGVEPAPGEDQP